MKAYLKNIHKGLILSAILFMLTACNTEDDINAIFRENNWYLTYIQDGNTKRYPKDKLYSIEFKTDNFSATTPNGTIIKGKWYADGSDRRTFNCRNVQIDGNIAGDTIAEKMYGIIKNAKNYEGDTNWLQIRQNKETYMQFYNR